MVPLKARWTILRGISRHHTQCFPTLSAANECVISTVVSEIPAKCTSTTRTFDGEVAVTLLGTGGARIYMYPSSLCSGCNTCQAGFSNCRWQCIALSRVVFANKPSSQRETKVLYCQLPHTHIGHWHVVSTENEGIHHCTIKSEPEYVAVELPCLAPYPVVVAKLVGMVYSPHELIVATTLAGHGTVTEVPSRSLRWTVESF